MAEFVSQEMFNMFAVSAAKISAGTGKTLEESTALVVSYYEGTYRDQNLARDIEIAAKKVKDYMLAVLPPETLSGNLTQMQFCIKNYKLDGTKKRKKIWDGTFFNKEKKEIENKIQNCLASVATYHTLVVGGSIPIAPQGWSL